MLLPATNPVILVFLCALLLITITALISLKIRSMKSKTVNALVIYANIFGVKNYVSTKTVRTDNRYMVGYHKEVTEAIPFVTEQEAQQFIARIYNLHNREFNTEPAMVPAKDIAPVKIAKEKFA
jgi:Holliday junction resolvase